MRAAAEQIEVSYGAKKILKEVSLEARNREFVGIIGPNGSGKSTLLKCIYRVLNPEKGCVYLDETRMQNMSAVSYTHLDVYKRQVMGTMNAGCHWK